MRTIYLDLSMGAAGDMLSAALYELLPDEEKAGFLAEIGRAGIPGVTVAAEAAKKCGIKGTHFKVFVDGIEEGAEASHHHDHGEEGHDHDHHDHDHEDHDHGHHDHGDDDHDHCHEGHHHGPSDDDHDHGHHDHDHEDHDHAHHDHEDHHHDHDGHHHASMQDIEELVGSLKLPETVRENVLNVYRMIAEAESSAHGTEVSMIHFHEVGMMDAVADITAVCLAMEKLKPEKVLASKIHVGSGQVRCAHGIMPVPAPATAYILKDVPIYGGSVRGELCTPTGAALVKYFADSFGEMPVMRTKRIGYGMGKKDFEAANCLRAMLGESGEGSGDTVIGLSCNVDDMTGEEAGFAYDRLFEAGALEVYTVPVMMKKNRPGQLIEVLCRPEDREKVICAIFKHTTTIGIRETVYARHVLKREEKTAQSAYGPVRVKESVGYGVTRRKPAFDDLAQIAVREGISLSEARKITGIN
ncbi:MAG: nickel pincer cofactor biosynthesis protein LarC [Lachnospiraceae bacterium]|nr:nickel pincer cofactor biosynthesis protein LarC [Lachnospiraceae bacterium]